MLLTIADVLSVEELGDVRSQLKGLQWRDGGETAGAIARRVKRNRQADLATEAGAKLRKQLSHAVLNHQVFRSAARPHKMSPLMISRSGVGDGYGMHVDNAYMGSGVAQVRADLSYTLFLSDAEEYEGGELHIQRADGSQKIKLRAGDMVLYPSTTLHEICPVTSGERLVAIGWVQSRLRDERQREILFDLDNLKTTLHTNYAPESAEILTLQKTISNLLRMWGND